MDALNWLNEHPEFLTENEGKWVAMTGAGPVTVGDSLKEVHTAAARALGAVVFNVGFNDGHKKIRSPRKHR